MLASPMYRREAMVSVLLVEDDADLRDMTRLFLWLEGFVTATAGNGQEALQLLGQGLRPSVIVLDLMPVMDGFRFRTAQLRRPELAAIPVIVLSAWCGRTAIEAEAVLTKPLNLNDLLIHVRRFCQSASASGI